MHGHVAVHRSAGFEQKRSTSEGSAEGAQACCGAQHCKVQRKAFNIGRRSYGRAGMLSILERKAHNGARLN